MVTPSIRSRKSTSGSNSRTPTSRPSISFTSSFTTESLDFTTSENVFSNIIDEATDATQFNDDSTISNGDNAELSTDVEKVAETADEKIAVEDEAIEFTNGISSDCVKTSSKLFS